jgi:hypothetical protein
MAVGFTEPATGWLFACSVAFLVDRFNQFETI